MGTRWFVIVIAVAAAATAGCGGAPSAKFVLSDRTKKLDRPARSAVEAELQKGFGDPNQLVAWEKLPVDFGKFEGVVAAPAEHSGNAFVMTARLTRNPSSKVPVDPDDIRGAGLLWNSGTNKDVIAEVKGKDVRVDFQLNHYQEADGHAQVDVIPAELAASLEPPQPGDKFTVLGPVLQHGRKVYMTQCEHCHGVSGDGNGPTAQYFDVKPRDYRLGRFKFTSTKSTDKARHEDLMHTVRQGIPGTYMPSFLLLGDAELGSVIEYVRWLSMRGEFEQKLVGEMENDYSTAAIAQRTKGNETRDQIDAALTKYLSDEFPAAVTGKIDEVVMTWNGAEQPDALVLPGKGRSNDSGDSRERGRKLFLSDKAKCASCHGAGARGDGPQTEDYQNIPMSTKKYATPGLFDDWGNAIKPRDLTAGIYRGGRRPIDLYRRISAGIKGTPMPAFGSALNDDEIWDLVNYVMSIPYQKGPDQPENEIHQSKIASLSASASQAGRAD